MVTAHTIRRLGLLASLPLFRQAFVVSLPVCGGYLFLSSAFGLLFSGLGYHWSISIIMSLFVYAGAAQYFSIGLLAAGTGLFEIFIATCVINSRHSFYGFSFLQRYSGWRFLKPYLIFGLTDETYSLLTSHRTFSREKDRLFCFFVTLFNHFYWVSGSLLGSLLGKNATFSTAGFEFTLTALFVVLTIEQARSVQRLFPFLIASVAAAGALLFNGKQMLLIALSLTILMLIAGERRFRRG